MTDRNTSVMMAVLLTMLTMPACKDDAESAKHGAREEKASGTTLLANEFVRDIMETYYYWNAEMPTLDYARQMDTEKYFYKLLSSKDRFSYITDDADSYWDEDEGISTSMGWEYALSYMSSTGKEVCAMICYVYENTPASRAGVRRGDLVTAVDGETMTADNYQRLLGKSEGKYTIERRNAAEGEPSELTLDMAKVVTTVNYIPVTKVLELPNGNKVGYMLYMSYSTPFDAEMEQKLKEMEEAGINDLILDLRYNRGGAEYSMTRLCSMIAPQSNVTKRDELLYYEFNSLLTKEMAEEYSREATHVLFTDTMEAKLDLKRLVVLTGEDTYSASEATIWGLKPYMEVTLVGGTTGGKNSMMYVLSPEDFVYTDTGKPFYSSKIYNWLVLPIVAVSHNSTGESFDTSDGHGLAPDIYVDDMYHMVYDPYHELGDPEEALTAAALKYLTTGEKNEDANKALQTTAMRRLDNAPTGRRGGLTRRCERTKR